MCGSAPSGAFQRRKVDLLLSRVTSAAAARERRRRLPRPRRAQQAVRSGRCAEQSVRSLACALGRVVAVLAGGRAGMGVRATSWRALFQSVEDDGKEDLSELEKVLISTV